MIEHVLDRLHDAGNALWAAASAPVVPKSVISNIVEKLAIVAIGAGVALWANDQRQSDKIDQLVHTLTQQEQANTAAQRRLEEKLDRLEREGSRPVIELRTRVETIDSRLQTIEKKLDKVPR